MDTIELARKTDWTGQIFGIFYLPNNKGTPFVTWLIMVREGKEDTYHGHYHRDLIIAVEEFKNRS